MVDDHEDSAEMVAEVLRRGGHRVRTAWDSFRAIQLLKDEPAALTFLDIAMPGRDGYDLARQLKQDYADMKLVALTGFGGEEHRAKARAIGIDELLTKPVSLDRLLPLVDRLSS